MDDYRWSIIIYFWNLIIPEGTNAKLQKILILDFKTKFCLHLIAQLLDGGNKNVYCLGENLQ